MTEINYENEGQADTIPAVQELGSLATAESMAQQIYVIEDLEHNIHSLLPKLSQYKCDLRKRLVEIEQTDS